MFPDVEGEEGLEAGDGRSFDRLRNRHRAANRVVRAGLLGDDEGAVGGGGEPYPAGAEEGEAFGDEVGFEGVEGAPLRLDLGEEFRFLDFGFACARNDRSITRPELRKVQVMIQDLASVVEDGRERPHRGPHGRLDDDVFQGHRLELGAGDEFVEIVDITLQMLAVVERQGLGADRGRQRVGSVG